MLEDEFIRASIMDRCRKVENQLRTESPVEYERSFGGSRDGGTSEPAPTRFAAWRTPFSVPVLS